MRLLAIGDIHGYKVALEALLSHVAPSPSDQVIFLGDYVHKGPDTAGTLELLAGLGESHRDWVFLRGNHDQLLIDAYRDPSTFGVWEALSGENPLSSYGAGTTADQLMKVPERHIRFLEGRCRDVFETDDFIFVHGGIRPDVAPGEEELEHLHWMKVTQAVPHHSSRTVICGHTSQETGRIVDLGHTICIDTGISREQRMTCLDLEDFSFVQASESGETTTGRLRVESAGETD